MLLSVALVMGFLCQSAVSYRVIGWKLDYYTENSATYLGTNYQVGDYNSGGTWITWGAWFGWGFNKDTYCYLRLKMSSTSGARHFQIKGTEAETFDMRSRYTCVTSGTGDRTGTKLNMASGKSWSGCDNDWGFRYFSVYGEWTTERPLISAFSYQQLKASERSRKKPEKVMGPKLNTDVEVNTGEFQCWTSDWDSNTMVVLRYYEPATKLVKFEAHFDRKRVKQITDVSAKYRVIQNDGCGTEYVDGMTGTQTNTIEVAVSTTVGWSKTFGFNFEISSTVGGSIGSASAEVTMTAGFNYEQSSNFEETQSKTEKNEYKWPTYCAPGFKCRTDIMRKTEDVILPTTFTFERGTETFTEENDMETTIQSTHETTVHNVIDRTANCGRRRRRLIRQ